MNAADGFAPSVLETLELPAALALVADHAAGPQGAERVRARRPLTDVDAVQEALAEVAELAAAVLADDGVRAEPVEVIAEPLALLAVPGSALEGPALAAVTQFLAAARSVTALLGRLEPDAPRTAALRVPLPPQDLDTRLRRAIGPDGEVLDAASRALGQARRALRETRAALVRRLETILGGLDATDRAPDAAVTVRNGRYVIPVRTSARAAVGGIVHDASATHATVFVEPPDVIELGNELRSREAQVQREVLRVLRELTDVLRPHRETLAAAWEMCVAFDDRCARARYAVAVNGFAPAIGAAPLTIRQGRHPLLVGGDAVVVPFDLVLAPDEWTVLVSGPNTGGKTVLIKAVGLLCLLAQCGVIPPIGPQSRLPLFTGCFADIGDRQSIAASLSTFSAHVAALADLLAAAGPGSLVLLDEIGSGTDPAEGGALAAAVLRTLTRRRAVTLATTHLGALKRLASETVGIVNASLQFDAETLAPTYRFVKGMPGRSYGLAIARRLGLPDPVLREAEQAVPDAERALDALLAEVEARGRALADGAAELAQARAALDAGEAAADERERALRERDAAVGDRERHLDQTARAQARAYLLDARRKVEAALALARAAVDEATAREARRLVEDAVQATRLDDAGGPVGGGAQTARLTVGDRARMGSGAAGTVCEIRSDGTAVLDVGSVRLVAPLAELTPVAGKAERAAGHGLVTGRGLAETNDRSAAISEIDLRGLRAEEVGPAVTRALDAAVLADLPYLRIIHGKGTGALRAQVRAVLAADPRVVRFALAPAAQGGSGVTVAELRA